MKRDSLKQFVQLRQQLATEKDAIVKRLAEIESVLSGVAAVPVKAAKVKAKDKRPSNELSLKEAILKVIQGKSFTKQEIFDAITKLGYKFAAKDPINSINVVLYGKKPKFKNNDGKFSV